MVLSMVIILYKLLINVVFLSEHRRKLCSISKINSLNFSIDEFIFLNLHYKVVDYRQCIKFFVYLHNLSIKKY